MAVLSVLISGIIINGPLVFEADGMLVACGFVDVPVPDGEAEENAKTNLMWKDAVKVTSTHQAHVLIYVLNATDAIKRSLLHTKVTCSFLKMENAIGVYQNSTVLSPEFYIEGASSITKGYLPILNWVHFGLYPDKDGVSGYTVGLNKFGKDEIEVIMTKKAPIDLYDLMVSIAGYVIENDVTLRDGETIGFSPAQRLKITRSEGVAVEGQSLKIAF